MYWILLIIINVLVGFGQDFQFSKSQSNQSKNIRPIYIPGRCPENQLLYPVIDETDWICDCGPGFIYYQPLDGCYRPYKKGPCNDNEMLTINKKNNAAECIQNPCKDGFALFKGRCYQMDVSSGPCDILDTFGLNSTTLEIGCLKGVVGLSILSDFPLHCPPGRKRNGKSCRIPYV